MKKKNKSQSLKPADHPF